MWTNYSNTKILGVLKNYVSSFASNVDDNIEKAREKADMIFSSDFNRRKTNPLIYVKFWRQACLPSLLFGTELFTLNAASITSRGVLTTTCDSLHKYNLFHYLELWFRESIFPTYSNWKTIVKTKILEKEADDWFRFCSDHPSMRVAQTCLQNISPCQFWSIANRYPDLVSRLHVQQIRLMGNFGLNGGVPWLTNTNGELCLFCRNSVKDVSHFLSDCPSFRDNFEFLWSDLSQKILACNPSDGLTLLAV